MPLTAKTSTPTPISDLFPEEWKELMEGRPPDLSNVDSTLSAFGITMPVLESTGWYCSEFLKGQQTTAIFTDGSEVGRIVLRINPNSIPDPEEMDPPMPLADIIFLSKGTERHVGAVRGSMSLTDHPSDGRQQLWQMLFQVKGASRNINCIAFDDRSFVIRQPRIMSREDQQSAGLVARESR